MRVTVAEWNAKGRELFGDNVNQWSFVCPSCGHLQTRQDWLDVGLSPRQVDHRIGFTCIGRWLDPIKSVHAFEPSAGFGCRYVGNHEPNISPITLVISENPPEERPTFAYAKPQ